MIPATSTGLFFCGYDLSKYTLMLMELSIGHAAKDRFWEAGVLFAASMTHHSGCVQHFGTF